jgi:hypothetical protein
MRLRRPREAPPEAVVEIGPDHLALAALDEIAVARGLLFLVAFIRC